jgi:hypothetical protein
MEDAKLIQLHDMLSRLRPGGKKVRALVLET